MQPQEDPRQEAGTQAALVVDQRVGPGSPVRVSADRIAGFAAAVSGGEDPPTSVDRARSDKAGVAPPTLVVALALSSPGGPADLLWPQVAAGRAGGVVHGDQQLTVHRPVVAGDALVFASRVATVRRIPAATMTAIATSVTSGDGAPVADLTATFVLTDPA